MLLFFPFLHFPWGVVATLVASIVLLLELQACVFLVNKEMETELLGNKN